jgi:hypothetical protein
MQIENVYKTIFYYRFITIINIIVINMSQGYFLHIVL